MALQPPGFKTVLSDPITGGPLYALSESVKSVKNQTSFPLVKTQCLVVFHLQEAAVHSAAPSRPEK